MANMGYCKFENTLDALRDCLRHIEVGEETSESEIECAKSLYETCKVFIDRCIDYGIRRENDEGYESFEDNYIYGTVVTFTDNDEGYENFEDN